VNTSRHHAQLTLANVDCQAQQVQRLGRTLSNWGSTLPPCARAGSPLGCRLKHRRRLVVGRRCGRRRNLPTDRLTIIKAFSNAPCVSHPIANAPQFRTLLPCLRETRRLWPIRGPALLPKRGRRGWRWDLPLPSPGLLAGSHIASTTTGRVCRSSADLSSDRGLLQHISRA
jgi:hypothetical protein